MSAAEGTPWQTHAIGGGVECVGVPVLTFAGRACSEFMDDEVIDQIIDLHGRHADQVQPVQVTEHVRQQPPRLRQQGDFFRLFGHGEAILAGCAITPAARSSLDTMSLKLSVGFISHSMPILIQNAACALIDLHDTPLALRSWSCRSSSMFTMPMGLV